MAPRVSRRAHESSGRDNGITGPWAVWNAFSPRGFRAPPLEGGHSHRLGAFGPLGDFELDALILLEAAEAAFLDLRMVDEYILSPPSGAMNPKPLSLLNHFTVPCVIRISLSFGADEISYIRVNRNTIQRKSSGG